MNNYITLYENKLSSKDCQTLIDKFELYTHLHEKEHITANDGWHMQFTQIKLANQEVMLGTSEDYILQTTDSKSKILLNTGNDIIQRGKGINTFYFRRGDGSDVIGDAGGLDELNSLNFNKKEVA